MLGSQRYFIVNLILSSCAIFSLFPDEVAINVFDKIFIGKRSLIYWNQTLFNPPVIVTSKPNILKVFHLLRLFPSPD